HGYGVGRLLKALRHEAPGVAETAGRLGLDRGTPVAAQVLRTVHTAHGGKLSIVRVLAGEINDGAALRSADGRENRVSGILRVMGAETTKRDTARVGDTVALGKLEFARTGDTLYPAGREADAARQLAPPDAAEPVMAFAI